MTESDDYKNKLTDIVSYVIEELKKQPISLLTPSVPINEKNSPKDDYTKKLTEIVSHVIDELKKEPSSSKKLSYDYNKKLAEIASYVINELKNKKPDLLPIPVNKDLNENLKKIIPDILKKLKESLEKSPGKLPLTQKLDAKSSDTPIPQENVINPTIPDGLKDDVMKVMWKLQNNILTSEKGQNMDIELTVDNKKSKYNTIRKIERLLATLKKKGKQNKTTKAKVSGKIVFNNKKEEPKITTNIQSDTV
jgi:hypothetical protein